MASDRDRSDAIIIRYEPAGRAPRRWRFEPRAGEGAAWTRYEEVWNGCQWRPVGSEPCDGVRIETPSDETARTVTEP